MKSSRPQPTVLKERGKQRRGKGFSRKELEKTGLNAREALKLGFPVDSRRRTAHQENINAIEACLEMERQQSNKKKKRKA